MADVTFTRDVRTFVPGTGHSVSSSTVTGLAYERFSEDRKDFRAGTMTMGEDKSLFFSPSSYPASDLPKPGDTVVWPPTGGETFTVKSVSRLNPDGVESIAAIVRIARGGGA